MCCSMGNKGICNEGHPESRQEKNLSLSSREGVM